MSEIPKDLSYEEAKKQLEEILKLLEQGTDNIDELESLLEKSKALVSYCQLRLRNIEANLEKE